MSILRCKLFGAEYFSWKSSFFLVFLVFVVGIGVQSHHNWWDISSPFRFGVFHHISGHLRGQIYTWTFFWKVGTRSASYAPLLGRNPNFLQLPEMLYKHMNPKFWYPWTILNFKNTPHVGSFRHFIICCICVFEFKGWVSQFDQQRKDDEDSNLFGANLPSLPSLGWFNELI